MAAGTEWLEQGARPAAGLAPSSPAPCRHGVLAKGAGGDGGASFPWAPPAHHSWETVAAQGGEWHCSVPAHPVIPNGQLPSVIIKKL